MHKGKEPYLSIYKIVGFYPDNVHLYKQAFLHKSQSAEDDDGKWSNNERLEFLGDAILNAVVTDIVYKHFRNKSEGFLTNTRSKIVSRESMNRISLSLGIEPMLRYSSHEPIHEMHNSSMLGNALEALIGAVFLDQGFETCYRFIRDVLIKDHIDIDEISETEVNFKSKLIEWGQKHHLQITFETIESFMDEQSNPVFQTAAVMRETGERIGTGIGYTKKESHQNAARMAMKKIRTDLVFQQHLARLKKRIRERKIARDKKRHDAKG